MKIFIFFLLVLLLVPISLAQTCDPEELYICQDNNTNLQNQLNSLQNRYNTLNNNYLHYKDLSDSLQIQLEQTSEERDTYRQLYENKSIGHITISDWKSLNQTINQEFFNISNIVNGIKIQQTFVNFLFVINVVVSLALMTFGFFLYKNIFKKLEVSLKSIKSISKTNVKTVIHKNSNGKKRKNT